MKFDQNPWIRGRTHLVLKLHIKFPSFHAKLFLLQSKNLDCNKYEEGRIMCLQNDILIS